MVNEGVNIKNRLIPDGASRLRDPHTEARVVTGLRTALLASVGPPQSSAVYSPPTVSPSIRIVGEATLPRNSRSLAISEILQNMSLRLPATVISSTGYASSPLTIHIPEAPRE